MTAQDYPISFGYLAQDGEFYGPNGSVGLCHRGNDRETPTGTPVVICGVTLGLTGASGRVGGPHLHTQAGWDEWAQKTIDPLGYEFMPGTVVKVGEASQWGKYVCVRTDEGVNVFYCHLSSINVSVNNVIGGKEVNISQEAYDDFRNWKSYGMKVQNALHEAGVAGDPDQLIPVLKDLVGWKKDGMFYQNQVDQLQKQLGNSVTILEPGLYKVK